MTDGPQYKNTLTLYNGENIFENNKCIVIKNYRKNRLEQSSRYYQ